MVHYCTTIDSISLMVVVSIRSMSKKPTNNNVLGLTCFVSRLRPHDNLNARVEY
jgi:hypothetical protein